MKANRTGGGGMDVCERKERWGSMVWGGCSGLGLGLGLRTGVGVSRMGGREGGGEGGGV